MSSASISVDLFNPGQVFACLGFMELAEVLLGGVRAGFEWEGCSPARFHLHTAGSEDPFVAGLQFLRNARVRVLVPHGADDLGTEKWGLDALVIDRDAPFPQPRPQTPASLPAVLEDERHRFVIDSWGDASSRDNVKFWAGAGGYPGAALVRDALQLFPADIDRMREDPFSVSAPQSSSLRFDWRRDYVPLGIGFSLNEHGKKIVPRGYPLVEVLAVLGLTHARPAREHKLRYRYSVLGGEPNVPLLHRAALGCAPLPFAMRTFCMILDWPGQENQARCITSVSEEITS